MGVMTVRYRMSLPPVSEPQPLRGSLLLVAGVRRLGLREAADLSYRDIPVGAAGRR